jgi:hypothetical protein
VRMEAHDLGVTKENIHHVDLINHAYLTWKTHHWAVLIAEGVATNRKAHIICPNTFRKFPSRHLFSRTTRSR